MEAAGGKQDVWPVAPFLPIRQVAGEVESLQCLRVDQRSVHLGDLLLQIDDSRKVGSQRQQRLGYDRSRYLCLERSQDDDLVEG